MSATIFFIGDLHIGHKNCALYMRNFNSLQNHDEFLVQQWNDVVKPKDVVWLLGDVAWRCGTEYANQYLSRLRGNIRVVLGNHDSPDLLKRCGLEWQHGVVKKYKMWLTHCPIHPDELRGLKNVHGHVHYATIRDQNYYNVSAENIGYSPISLEEVRERWDK